MCNPHHQNKHLPWTLWNSVLPSTQLNSSLCGMEGRCTVALNNTIPHFHLNPSFQHLQNKYYLCTCASWYVCSSYTCMYVYVMRGRKHRSNLTGVCGEKTEVRCLVTLNWTKAAGARLVLNLHLPSDYIEPHVSRNGNCISYGTFLYLYILVTVGTHSKCTTTNGAK